MATAFWGFFGAIRLVLAYVLSLVQIFTPAILSSNMDRFYTDWSKTDEYSIEDTVVLEKEPGKDFVIVNISDVQLNEIEAHMSDKRLLVYRTIKKLIEDNQPDLITVSGDNAWGMTSYLWLIQMLDSFGIPWAPVMGNHDGQQCFSEDWCAYCFLHAKNSVFNLGPKDMGHGNYIISITENDKLVHTLYMMDSHDDGIWANQIEWYDWAVKGAGADTESTVIMHIPTPEYVTAWDEQCGADETDSQYGAKHEKICDEGDNSLFEKIVELGSTKNILVGHDHVNSFMLSYKGIGLNYSLKCGPGCYWEKELNGGTVITVGSDGHATLAQDYVDPDTLGVWYDA